MRFDELQKNIYTAAKLTARPPLQKKLQLWSPAMITNLYHFRFLQTLRRRTYTSNAADLQRLINKLDHQLLSLNRPDNPNAQTVNIRDLQIDDFNIADWINVLS